MADALKEHLEAERAQRIEDGRAFIMVGREHERWMRDQMDSDLASLPNDNARELYVHPTLGGLGPRRKGVAHTLDHLGYSRNDLTNGLYDAYGQQAPIPHAKVAQAMRERGMDKYFGSKYYNEALSFGDPDALAEAVRNPETTSIADIIEVHDPSRARYLRRGLELGLTVPEIENGPGPRSDVERLAEVTEALGPRNRHRADDVLRKGNGAGEVKSFGPRLASRYTREELVSSPTKHTVLRSLSSQDSRNMTLEQLDDIAAAGVTKGSDLAKFQKTLPPTLPPIKMPPGACDLYL